MICTEKQGCRVMDPRGKVDLVFLLSPSPGQLFSTFGLEKSEFKICHLQLYEAGQSLCKLHGLTSVRRAPPGSCGEGAGVFCSPVGAAPAGERCPSLLVTVSKNCCVLSSLSILSDCCSSPPLI